MPLLLQTPQNKPHLNKKTLISHSIFDKEDLMLVRTPSCLSDKTNN